MRNKCILFAALLMLSGTISAKVVLPPMFSDNMVLQQQADAPIWGEAKPMKTVKVTTSWDGKTYETQADISRLHQSLHFLILVSVRRSA